MRTIMLFLAALFLLPSSVFAAINVSGTWNARVDLGGQGGTPTFVLKQDGEKLTGKYNGALGDADLTGTLKGNAISFDFDVQGNKIHYEGKVSEDAKTMEGTCDYGGQASGTFKATRVEDH
jgi:autotransporter translocation and assembly factor TamB